MYASGTFAATGTKSFQCDHPLDPANKYLNHFCAEGPAPYNIYRGNVVTDGRGYATVVLPDYFESINRDPAYQLTVVDEADQEQFVLAKVVAKVRNNRFTIRTSRPQTEVSWEVKAIRNDRWVQRYGYETVQEKEPGIRGKYVHPELYNQPLEVGLHGRAGPYSASFGLCPSCRRTGKGPSYNVDPQSTGSRAPNHHRPAVS